MIGKQRRPHQDEAARRTAPGGRPLAGLVALALAGGLLAGLWPGAPSPALALIVPTGLALGATLYTWWRNPGHLLRPVWLLLALGISLSGLSALARVVADLRWAPLGDLFAALNLAAYPFYLLSHAVRIRRAAGRGLSGPALLDAATVTLVAGAFGAQLLIPLVDRLSAARLVGTALPPLLSLGHLLIVLYLVYQAPWRRSALALGLAIALVTAANWVFVLQATGALAVGGAVPVGLIAGTMLLLAAVPRLDEREGSRPAREPIEQPLPRLVLALPYLLLVSLAVALIVHRLDTTIAHDDLAHLWLERALSLCTLLVLLRQWLMLRTNVRLLAELRASHAALAAAHDNATREARTDLVTTLPNQRMLREHLTALLASRRRIDHPVAVLFTDVDFFKAVNDRFGHAAGNAALLEVGRRLRQAVREVDFVARYGGEEFVLVLPNQGEAEALAVAERVRQAVGAAPIVLPGGQTVALTISIGVALWPDSGTSAETLLHAADQALYAAKAAGRDCVRLTSAQCSVLSAQ